jgi:hypothetical protein
LKATGDSVGDTPATDDILERFLNQHAADAATVQHAVRYLAAELTDDASPEEMLDGVRAAVEDPSVVDDVLASMIVEPELLETIDLAVLQAAWDESPARRDAVRRAVIGAKTKLPVVEVAIICATALAMYHMYLRKTGGLKHISRALARTPEGTVTETETTEWFGPAGPLTSVTSQLTRVNPAQPTDA